MARNWEHEAGIVWQLLTAAAAKSTTLTYTDIAPQIKTNPLSVGHALRPIQSYCLDYRLPPLTAIVVGLNSNAPGGGFIAWDIDDLKTAHDKVYGHEWATVQNLFSGFGANDTIDSLARQILRVPTAGQEIYTRIRVRGMAQIIFREALLKAYRSGCALCGCTLSDALEAAHIIPWPEASPNQRLDPRNGLLLCSSHHRLFDRELLTVSRSLKIVYSDPKMIKRRYSEADRSLTGTLHGKQIHLPSNQQHWPEATWLKVRHERGEWGDLP